MTESPPVTPCTVIIPARLGSTRFPEKVLANATGRPLVWHVWNQARQARCARRVVVATDSPCVREAVVAFGGECVMTPRDCPSGTSRVAHAARRLGLAGNDLVANVQGDEPELDPHLLDAAVEALVRCGTPMATAAQPFAPEEDPADPNLVKVVLRADGTAMYFSRARIPYHRQASAPHDAACVPAEPLKHVGLYVYRASFLNAWDSLTPAAVEQTELLEQLRALYHGHPIAVAVGAHPGFGGIDTPQQYEAFVRRWQAAQGDG